MITHNNKLSQAIIFYYRTYQKQLPKPQSLQSILKENPLGQTLENLLIIQIYNICYKEDQRGDTLCHNFEHDNDQYRITIFCYYKPPKTITQQINLKFDTLTREYNNKYQKIYAKKMRRLPT